MTNLILLLILGGVFYYVMNSYNTYTEYTKEAFKKMSINRESLERSELGLFVALVAKVAKADGRVDDLEAQLISSMFNDISEIFPETPRDEHGFFQQTLETSAGIFLLLDTVEHGKHWGSYCEKRGAWLRSQLETAGSKAVYLFMHHPPFKIGIPSLDRISLREDAQRIQQIVSNFSNIKHLFFGHVLLIPRLK